MIPDVVTPPKGKGDNFEIIYVLPVELATGGAFSNENLAFKMLRINKELETLAGLKLSAYDKMMSLTKNGDTKVNIAENWWQFLGANH